MLAFFKLRPSRLQFDHLGGEGGDIALFSLFFRSQKEADPHEEDPSSPGSVLDSGEEPCWCQLSNSRDLPDQLGIAHSSPTLSANNNNKNIPPPPPPQKKKKKRKERKKTTTTTKTAALERANLSLVSKPGGGDAADAEVKGPLCLETKAIKDYLF